MIGGDHSFRVVALGLVLVIGTFAAGVGVGVGHAQTGDTAMEWSEFQNDSQNTGYSSTADGPEGYVTQNWTASIGGNLDMSPTVANGTIYAGGGLSDSNVYAVNATDGTIEWTFSTDDEVRSSPAVVNGTVYVGNDDSTVDNTDNTLFALNATTVSLTSAERKLWAIPLIGEIRTDPTVVNDTIYVQTDARVYSLNAADGSENWNRSIGGSSSALAVTSDTVYAGGSSSNKLHALNRTDGTTRWDVSTGSIYSAPTVVNDTVYVGSWDNNLYAVTATTGVERWNFSTNDNVYSSPAVANQTVYFGSEDSYFYAVNASDGSLRWKFQSTGPIRASPSIANETVYVGSMFSSPAKAYAFSTDGKLQWEYNPGGEVQGAVVPSYGNAYVPSKDNGLHAVEVNETQRNACTSGVSVSEINSPTVGVAGQSTKFPVKMKNTADIDCPVTFSVDFNQEITTSSRTIPANQSQYVYLSRTFSKSGTYTGTIKDSTVSVDVIDPVVKHSSISHVEGPQDTTPSLSASLNSFGMVSADLSCGEGEGGQLLSFNLSNCGANTSTVYEINLTIDNEGFIPRVLVSSGQDLNWTINNGTSTQANRTNISITARASELQYTSNATQLEDFETLSAKEDQADFSVDAAILMGISNGQNRFFQSGAQNLTNMTISTNAQNFRPPKYYQPTGSQDTRLEIQLAGPHLTADGAENQGFYRVFLPDSLLNEWDVSSAEELTADWSESSDTSLTTTDVRDGLRLNLSLTYSAGTATIKPDTTPPTAVAGNDQTIGVDSEVSVSGSGSTDNRIIDTYQWDFGDGTTATGQSATHTYSESGTYTVSLTVADGAGNTDTDTLTVTVETSSEEGNDGDDSDTGGGGGGGGGISWSPDEETESDVTEEPEGDDGEQSGTEPVDESDEGDDGQSETDTGEELGGSDEGDGGQSESSPTEEPEDQPGFSISLTIIALLGTVLLSKRRNTDY